MPQLLQNAVAFNILDNVNIGVQNGATFALPVKPGAFTWQTVFGSVPGSVTVNIQVSIDGINFTTVDTSTQVNGEVRQIPALTAPFVRATISASAGGTTATVIAYYKGRTLEGVPQFGTLLYTNVKQNGNVGAGLTTNWQFDLPANTLANNGDSFTVETLSQSAANATNKLTAISTTAQVIASESGVPTNGLPRLHRVHCIRTGPTTAQAWGEVETQGGASLINIGTPMTDDWRTVVSVKFLSQGGADNDIIHRMSQIYYYPVNGTYVGL